MAPPEEPGDPAREGTCAAWLAEVLIKDPSITAVAMVGNSHENGWIVDRAMAHHIQKYVDLLRSYGGDLDAERKVRLNAFIAGTPDAFGILSDGTLNVIDLKYGFEIVEVTTEQVAIYAGALVRHMTAHGVTIRKVRLGIYQPRAYHPAGIFRTWEMWPEELMSRVHKIEQAGAACQNDAAIATPGAHCRRCPAASVCSAAAHEVYGAVSRMLNGEQRQMSAAEIANELDFMAFAEAIFKGRRDAVHAEVNARMDRGEQIPRWTRESGVGQRRWKAPKEAIQLLTGIDPSSGKMVTPLELERLGADPEIIKGLVEVPRTKAALKPITQEMVAAKFGGTTATGAV